MSTTVPSAAGRERPLVEAFERLRRHARSSNTRLTELAAGVTDGSVDTAALIALPSA